RDHSPVLAGAPDRRAAPGGLAALAGIRRAPDGGTRSVGARLPMHEHGRDYERPALHHRARGIAAPRTPDGRFHNPWPDSEPHGLRDVLRMLRERRSHARAATPPRGSFPTAVPAIAYPRADTAAFSATWIGHSTVLLQLGSLNVITDP